MSEDKSESKELVKWIKIIVIIIVLVLVLLPVALHYVYDKPSDRGAFGDMFGAVNALFSGLAFAGVIIAIILQKKELKLQREELKETREVLNMTKEVHAEQMQTIKIQRFENTFFQMINLLHENHLAHESHKSWLPPEAFGECSPESKSTESSG